MRERVCVCLNSERCWWASWAYDQVLTVLSGRPSPKVIKPIGRGRRNKVYHESHGNPFKRRWVIPSIVIGCAG